MCWLGMVLGTSLDYALGRWGLHSTLGRTHLMARLEPKLAKLAAAQRFLASLKPQQTVTATVVRPDGKSRTVTFHLGELPVSAS